MAYIRRIWVARAGTFLNRFLKSNETANSVELVNDPTITEAGTSFTAAAMNNIEDGIEEALAQNRELTITATSGGALPLTAASKSKQQLTGTSAHTVVLPVVTTLSLGFNYTIINSSTQSITINSSGGNLVKTLLAGKSVVIVCVAITGTGAASWAIVDMDALTLNGHADSYFALMSYFTDGVANAADNSVTANCTPYHDLRATYESPIDAIPMMLGLDYNEFIIQHFYTGPITSRTVGASSVDDNCYIIKKSMPSDHSNCMFTAKNFGDGLLAEWETRYLSGGFVGWTKTRNADGSVPNATNAAGLLDPAGHVLQARMGSFVGNGGVVTVTLANPFANQGINVVITHNGVASYSSMLSTSQFVDATVYGDTYYYIAYGF